MRKPAALALFLFISGMLLGLRAHGAQSVALVTLARGGAVRKGAGGPWRKLYVLSTLEAGDWIRLARGEEAKIVFFSDNHAEAASGRCVVRVDRAHLHLVEGSAGSLSRFAPFAGISALQMLRSPRERFGGSSTRGAALISFLEEPIGMSADLKPAFQWEPVKGADKYKVSLEDENARKLWTTSTAASSLSYPGKTASLHHGKEYFWSVKAFGKGAMLQEASGSFRILDSSAAVRLRALERETAKQMKSHPDDTTPYAVLLAFYLQNGLLHKAMQACATLNHMDPGSAAVASWMKTIHALILDQRRGGP